MIYANIRIVEANDKNEAWDKVRNNDFEETNVFCDSLVPLEKLTIKEEWLLTENGDRK